MIDIQTALYTILHSRYGSTVRQAIHDGIYQINENANEAVQTAKAMGVGTAISSSSSSSAGYVSGNLYLNSSTWDLWQCVGTNSWQNKGNIKGATGATGADGASNYIYIRYSANYDGTDFTVSPTASSKYMGVYYGASTTAPTNKQDYQWTSYVGASGTSAYVFFMYSENADGSNFVTVPTANTKYIGVYSGSSSTAPANPTYYTWSKYVGNDGSGSGDMKSSEYAGSGVAGTVDKALNLRKTDGSLLSADNVSTKLSKIPNGNGTSGQVITSDGNGGATWEDSQGNTDIISDEWASGETYAIGDYAIYNNVLYKCIGNGGGSSVPSVSPTVWKSTTVGDELSKNSATSSGSLTSLLNNYSSGVCEYYKVGRLCTISFYDLVFSNQTGGVVNNKLNFPTELIPYPLVISTCCAYGGYMNGEVVSSNRQWITFRTTSTTPLWGSISYITKE